MPPSPPAPLTEVESAHATITGVRWSVVLATSHLATALKILDRVAAALPLDMHDIWLRPWREGERMLELRFGTAPPGEALCPAEAVGPLLGAAGRLSSTWTVVLPAGLGDGRIGFQGWTPTEIQTFHLEGVAHATFVAETGVPQLEPGPTAGVRSRSTAMGLLVNVVEDAKGA